MVDVSDTQLSGRRKRCDHWFVARLYRRPGHQRGPRHTRQRRIPLSSTYASTITTRQKSDEVRLTINPGDVKDTPSSSRRATRIPSASRSRRRIERGILDPMTASLLRAPGTGNPMSPEACDRTLAIFDGRLRYDLKLAYKRMEQVKADKG